jgi:hypothetical protein
MSSHLDLRLSTGRVVRRLASHALLGAVLLLGAACGDFPTSVSGTTRGVFRGGGTSSQSPNFSLPLIGEWRRTVVFSDVFGGTNVHATVWSFRTDGSFTRTIALSHVNSGATDTQSEHGRWETDGNTLLLLFNGAVTPLRVTFLFAGSALILGGEEYVRVFW